MSIARLEERLDRIQPRISELQASLTREPDDLADQLYLVSALQEEEEVTGLLRHAREERWKEVVELQFAGKLARDGTIPLHLIGDLMESFSLALYAASNFMRKGTVLKQIPSDLIQEMDLRLAGIGPGSTRVFITGNTKPDMFNNSLLERTLEATLDVLDAPNENEMISAVSGIGKTSANHLKRFLKTLDKSELEVNLVWDTPKDQERRWKGSQRTIKKTKKSLDHIEVTSTELRVEGIVTALDKRGKIKFEEESEGESTSRAYACAYPMSLYETVRRFRMDDRVVAYIEATTSTNITTKVSRTRYSLKTLRDPEEFARAGLEA